MAYDALSLFKGPRRRELSRVSLVGSAQQQFVHFRIVDMDLSGIEAEDLRDLFDCRLKNFLDIECLRRGGSHGVKRGEHAITLAQCLIGTLQLIPGRFETGEQLAVFHGDTHLPGDGGEMILLLVIEISEGAARNVDHTAHLIVNPERENRARPKPQLQLEFAPKLGIRRDIRRDDGLAVSGDPLDGQAASPDRST